MQSKPTIVSFSLTESMHDDGTIVGALGTSETSYFQPADPFSGWPLLLSSLEPPRLVVAAVIDTKVIYGNDCR